MRPHCPAAEQIAEYLSRYGPCGRSNLYFDRVAGRLLVRPERRDRVTQALIREAHKIAFEIANGIKRK